MHNSKINDVTYKVIKLINGETIIGVLTSDNDIDILVPMSSFSAFVFKKIIASSKVIPAKTTGPRVGTFNFPSLDMYSTASS